MRTEKGVALIVYKQKRGTRRFLILKRTKNWEGWEIPKGHLEDEDYQKTVKQELREEANIQEEEISNIESLETDLTWSYEDEETGEKVNREYQAYKVKVSSNTSVDVTKNPHEEHETGFFMKHKDAKSLLTHKNQKTLLNSIK